MKNPNNAEINKITKESIVQAFLILLKTKDYHNITISDIAHKAGVSRNAYYRNFYDKSDVIKYYLIDKWETFANDIISRNATDEEYAEKILYFIYAEKDFFMQINKVGLLYLFEKILYDIYKVENHATNFELYNIYWTIYFIYGTVKGIIYNNFRDNPKELLEIILKNMKRHTVN